MPTPSPTVPPTQPPQQAAATWRGTTIAPEFRCSPHETDDYHYYYSPQSVEPRTVQVQGGIYGPYTGTWFDSIRDTDIEHIVPVPKPRTAACVPPAPPPGTGSHPTSSISRWRLPASTDTGRWQRTLPSGYLN